MAHRRINNYNIDSSQLCKEGADALITINKNEIKGIDGAFYLEDNQPFELKLQAPPFFDVLAKIKWNGKEEKTGIIVRAGESIYLERFVDTNNRLTFKVTELPDNLADLVDKEKAGKIEVSFYKKVWSLSTPLIRGPYYPQGPGTPNAPHPYWQEPFYEYTDNTFFSAKSMTTSHRIGSVEKGEKTTQEFKESSETFEQIPMITVGFHLKSIKDKPKDKLIRKYCTKCGSRTKDKWEYCPYCGEKN
jgi:hypothetical protein